MLLLRYPRRRSDLLIQQQKAQTPYWVVSCPHTNEFFKLEEVEYQIFQLFDGTNALDELPKLCLEKFNLEVDQQELESFIQQLQEAGLLEQEAAVKLPRKREGFFQRIFYLPVIAFNPDPFLRRVNPYLCWAFNPYFVAGSILLIIYSIIIAASHNLLGQGWGSLFTAANLALLYLVFLIVGTLHEFAHAITCIYYGGRVREVGFLLLYFMPAFYTDTSSAWLFPKKSHRIWVSLAGTFFEFVIWALAVLLWRVTDSEGILHKIALVTILASGVEILFNFNPLIKLDGYYMLMDLVEIPNLRSRAFAYLLQSLRCLITGRAQEEKTTPRERRIFWIYSISALVYTSVFISLSVYIIGSFLIHELGGFGWILLLALLFLALYTPARVIYNFMIDVIKDLMLPEKRKRVIVILGIIVLLVGAALITPWELVIKGPFEVKAYKHVSVTTPIAGIVKELKIEQGTHVQKGDLLAALDDREYALRLAESRARLEMAEKKVATLTAQYNYHCANYERMAELYKKGVVSSDEHEKAASIKQISQKELEQAQAEVKSIQQSVDLYDFYLQQTEIKAPISGIVVTQRPQEKLGKYVSSGEEICQIDDITELRIEIHISEKDAAELRHNHHVDLKFASLPFQTFTTSELSLAPSVFASNPADQQVLIVTCFLKNPPRELKAGMTGWARIHAGKRSLLGIILRDVVRFFRVEFWWLLG